MSRPCVTVIWKETPVLPSIRLMFATLLYQSLQVPPVSSIDLPRLASGAVIPPNREFLAVLGDQRQGTNIEAPAEMIRQMVADGIRAAGIGNGNGNRSQTVILQVGRRELGRVVYELNKEETQRVGVRLAGVKA